MRGIIGIIARETVASGLLEGLRRLEYCGDDSAGHIALLTGTDVDQPRNLAKSVTVE